MGEDDNTKNSKRISEIVEMEQEVVSSLVSSKRAKVLELEETDHSLVVLSPEKKTTTSNFFFSDELSSSRCSSNDSRDSCRFPDLEATSFVTELSSCNNNKFSRETSPISEICVGGGGDSEEQTSSMDHHHTPSKNMKKTPESTTTRRSQRNPPAATVTAAAAAKMPSLAEIDEFFSVAEKYEQKRFAEKYNYDIVKDVPLEGRYQWVRLN